MSSKIKVSILVPVFNGEDSIKNCILSIINQTYENIEIIISDNCSTDNTQEILEEFIKKDKRIQYIRQKQNIGGWENFFFLLKKANSSFINFLGHDDRLDSDYIEKSLEKISVDENIAIISPMVIYYSDTSRYSCDFGVIHDHQSSSPIRRCASYFFKVKDNGVFYGMWNKKYVKNLLDIKHQAYKDRDSYSPGLDHIFIGSLLLNGKMVYSSCSRLYREIGHGSMVLHSKNLGYFRYIFALLKEAVIYTKNVFLLMRKNNIKYINKDYFWLLLTYLIVLTRMFFKRPLGVTGSKIKRFLIQGRK